MAAITENSVVAALAEVRRVGEDRRRRDAESRRQRDHQARREAEIRRRREHALRTQSPDLGDCSGVIEHRGADPGLVYGGLTLEPRPPLGMAIRHQPRSWSLTPAVVVAVIFLAAGAFGYHHLERRFEAVLEMKAVQLAAAQAALEAARVETTTVGERARDELRQVTTTCEARVSEVVAEQQKALASLVAASAAAAPAAPAPSRAARSSRSRGRSTAVAPAPAVKPTKRIVKRRRFSDDPLGGLGL